MRRLAENIKSTSLMRCICSTAAFNALLKALEEPPGHVKFIFATTDMLKLPTILSRTQRFDLRRISIPDIMDRLRRDARRGHYDW